MGLFSRKRLVTSSTTLNMVEDTPDIIKQSVLSSIVGNTNIATDLTNTMLDNLSAKTRSYWTYGLNQYTNGLPEGTTGLYSADNATAQTALDIKHPAPSGKENYVNAAVAVDTYDIDFITKEWLRRNTDWDELTNLLTNPTIPSDGKVWVFDTVTKTSSTTLSIRIFKQSIPINIFDTITATTEYPMIANEYYYEVSYLYKDSATQKLEGEPRYWTYQVSSNEFPDLTVTPQQKFTQFLPIVPLRINNKSLTKDDGSELYRTSKQLLRKVDIKIEELDDGINGNPDIADVDHAYFMMGIDIKSTKPESIRYMFEFFDDLRDRSIRTKQEFERWYQEVSTNPKNNAGLPPYNLIEISDGTYHTKLLWNYIERNVIDGSIGSVGTTTKEITSYIAPEEVSIAQEFSSSGYQDKLILIENPANKLILRQQISTTQYIELIISGLVHYNNIYGPDKDYVTTLENVEERSILIPLNLSIVENMPMLIRNRMLYDAFKCVFNCFEYIKLKWYQTTFFQIVTIVIAIAVTVYSLGTASPLTSAVLAAVGVAATTISIIIANMIIGLTLSYAFKLVADELNIEFALVLAVVLMAYGYFGSESVYALPFATEVAAIGSAFMAGIQQSMKEQAKDIAAELNESQVEYEDSMEEIRKINEELNPERLLDSVNTWTNVGMFPNESPSSYYERNLYLDTGDLTIQAIPNFYQSTIQYPL